MTFIISVVNQKGGVGKTTTSVNIATAFAAIRKNVLLIDLDPQGNASTGVGIDRTKRSQNIYRAMVNNNIIDNIVNTNITNFNIVPSVVDLSAAELELINYPNKEFVLNKLVQQIEHNYDYIIIDCPPSLGMLTINALTTCRDIIVPLQCEFFALEGLSHLLNTVKLVKSRLNNDLTILGILLTMYDRRNRITEEVEQDVRHYLGDLVFKTVIPRNSKLSEAPSHGVPAILYDHKCIGARSYAYLVKEILSKVKLAEQVGVLVNE